MGRGKSSKRKKNRSRGSDSGAGSQDQSKALEHVSDLESTSQSSISLPRADAVSNEVNSEKAVDSGAVTPEKPKTPFYLDGSALMRTLADGFRNASADEQSTALEENGERFFRLKSMVAARMLAEITALSAMVLTPLILFCLGSFQGLSTMLRFLFLAVALVAACILPIYGTVTYQVSVTRRTLTAYRLFGNRKCDFRDITKVSRRANFNVIRFVVEYLDGDLSFPAWLKNVDSLVSIIKANMPAYVASKPNSTRVFKQDAVATFFQVCQVLVSLIFVLVVLLFTAQILSSAVLPNGTVGAIAAGQTDKLLLAIFAVVISVLLTYRAYVILLMPISLKVTEEGLELQTFFSRRTIAKANLRAIKEPLPLLPEGFMICAQDAKFLVGTGMDAADELEAAVRELCPEG
ncbi:MAG: hypothetical protein K2Y32_15050 [Candidatus Obscuribacterales bacterium]|nr:hypothetical protein [Candidatus Obscuribacterales bacterium]